MLKMFWSSVEDVLADFIDQVHSFFAAILDSRNLAVTTVIMVLLFILGAGTYFIIGYDPTLDFRHMRMIARCAAPSNLPSFGILFCLMTFSFAAVVAIGGAMLYVSNSLLRKENITSSELRKDRTVFITALMIAVLCGIGAITLAHFYCK